MTYPIREKGTEELLFLKNFRILIYKPLSQHTGTTRAQTGTTPNFRRKQPAGARSVGAAYSVDLLRREVAPGGERSKLPPHPECVASTRRRAALAPPSEICSLDAATARLPRAGRARPGGTPSVGSQRHSGYAASKEGKESPGG